MRLAAVWGNYTFEQFIEMDVDNQAAVIASYRIEKYSDGVLAHRANNKGKAKKP